MMDLGALPHDQAARDLAREYVAAQKDKAHA